MHFYVQDVIGKKKTKLTLIRIENAILNIVNSLYNENKLVIDLTKLSYQ